MSNKINIQEFMIGKIEEAIKEQNELLKKASDSDKPKIRIKISKLEKQLENAKKPVVRTEKEKELIDKIANKVKENAEVITGNKIEGDRADKPLTSKEEFEHGVSMFIEEIKLRKEQLLKDISTQEGIVKLLEEHEPIGDENSYKAEIQGRKNILGQMKMSLELFNDRIDTNEDIVKWALENYDNISKLNTFLNNPLKLKDYEDYVAEKRKKFNV